jgi:hypothetical protein
MPKAKLSSFCQEGPSFRQKQSVTLISKQSKPSSEQASESNNFSDSVVTHGLGFSLFFRAGEVRAPISSGQGSASVPFQRWYHFKEAFSPTFVKKTIEQLGFQPTRCVDPFGGSGTTALSCQFLGIEPLTIEINPFLADLTEAKLSNYDIDRLVADRVALVGAVNAMVPDLDELFSEAPPTLCEPGKEARWIFDRDILYRIAQFRLAIGELSSSRNARLFRVLLGACLLSLSNVIISGKGRRYKRGWQRTTRTPAMVDEAFEKMFKVALFDICRFSMRACSGYRIIRGDSRKVLDTIEESLDLALFSPPYPNSFDYTDIYNVELWVLGYLETKVDNANLRRATLRSHVQIKHAFVEKMPPSPLLERAVAQLEDRSDMLWDTDIPRMVTSYFHDLVKVMRGITYRLSERGRMVLVVGDSRYAGVLIDVPGILEELAPCAGLLLESRKPIRSMRSSAQQGHHNLEETQLHFFRT